MTKVCELQDGPGVLERDQVPDQFYLYTIRDAAIWGLAFLPSDTSSSATFPVLVFWRFGNFDMNEV